jgi:hypothetical protein
MKSYLHKLLGNKNLVTLLLYSGSEHGWTFNDFHSRCNNKAPTISLFKIKDKDCIGGFTSAQWTSEDKFVGDIDAMLFNLSRCRHFPSRQTWKEVWCRDLIGPSFGYGELSANDEPFNGEMNCASYANNHAYGISVEGGKNMLTNKRNGKFTITELEVW